MTSILQRGRRTSLRLVTRAAIALGVAMGLVAVTASGCGTDNGVVGGVCAPGFTECAARCVDLEIDGENCGACGNVCSAATPCASGVCGFDATVDGDGGGDATVDALDDPLDERPRCDTLDPCRKDCRPPPGAVCDDAGEGGATGETGPGDEAGLDGSADGTVPEGGGNDGSASDGSVGEGGSGEGGSGSDGGGSEAGSNDGGSSESGTVDSGPVDATTPDACTPPYNTVISCGACNKHCLSMEVCALNGTGMYTCQPKCAPPLTNCGGTCVNLLRDPLNCGLCFNQCPSRLCLLATCQGDVAGNVVVIGHDYRQSSGGSQQSKLLNNAIFLNNTNALRILSFEHYADPIEVQIVKQNFGAYAASHNVALTITVSNNDDDVTNGILKSTNQDVLLVFDQSLAPAGTLGPLGARWASKLSAFAIGGGIVISLNGGQGINEMPAFDTNAALLSVTANAALAPGAAMKVVATNDALSRGLVSQYAAELYSVRFATPEVQSAKTIFVVLDQATGQPVVVHKIVN